MDGIQRLANMLEGQKDKYLIKITNYLMTQTDMQEAFLKKEKNLKGMAQYIKELARKEMQDYVAVMDDEEVYQWAKDYFNKSNEELGIEENKTQKANKIKENDDEFGSIFGETIENAQEEKKEEIEQISLFGI